MNYLEIQIDKIIKHINENELGFGWKNHPNRTFTGQYKEGETFDYTIFTKTKKMVFDAKETDKNKWQVLDKDKKQAINLLKCQKIGVNAFFLIFYIKDKKLVKININDFFSILPHRKYIMQSDCKEVDINEFLE